MWAGQKPFDKPIRSGRQELVNTSGLDPSPGWLKGIPRKNILPFWGKPLLQWTIDAALASACVDQVVVSTEDQEIAEVAKAGGAEVPFLRPADLATDEAPGILPVLHALEQLPKVTDVLLLQIHLSASNQR